MDVKLIGLDFGTTTSSCVVADTRLIRGAVGRVDFDSFRECFRSEMVFTPLEGERLDVARLEELLAGWLAAAGVQQADIFGGGALLTGLTAQTENARALVQLIRTQLKNALIASADDPCLESWLAFMGSAASLSRAHSERWLVNLDIGGGTTNLALGRNGQVFRTGCLFIGARHIQVEPGSYRIVRISPHGRMLLDQLGMAKQPGDELTGAEVSSIVDACAAMLLGQISAGTPAGAFEQVPFRMPEEAREPVITFSGGVGELIYAHLEGRPWPATTCFGDLGIDLARRLLEVTEWRESLESFRPASGGRATVYGLLRHSTEVSGSTLFLPDARVLPLVDVPILGSFSADADTDSLRGLLELAARSRAGACLQLDTGNHNAASIARLGKQLASLLRSLSFPGGRPLVILMRENLGKVLGSYITEWGRLPVSLIVIDEVTYRAAQFVQIGAARGPVVPVSFHGFAPGGETP